MKPFNMETSKTDDNLIVSISGELDASSALEADTIIEKAIASNIKTLLINCLELSYISSAGLGVFLAHFQTCRRRNIQLVFYGMSPKIKNIFDIVGLQNIFSIVDSYEDARSITSERN